MKHLENAAVHRSTASSSITSSIPQHVVAMIEPSFSRATAIREEEEEDDDGTDLDDLLYEPYLSDSDDHADSDHTSFVEEVMTLQHYLDRALDTMVAAGSPREDEERGEGRPVVSVAQRGESLKVSCLARYPSNIRRLIVDQIYQSPPEDTNGSFAYSCPLCWDTGKALSSLNCGHVFCTA